jgi:hypothetical protein
MSGASSLSAGLWPRVFALSYETERQVQGEIPPPAAGARGRAGWCTTYIASK